MHATLRSLLGLSLVTSAALAGPLTPPAGPVGSTYKTIVDVEPRIAVSSTNTPGDASYLYRITQPGSYYLTGNLGALGVYPGGCILIAANNVTLDLNGFTISGPGPSSTSRNGITITAAQVAAFPGVYAAEGRHNVTIKNGTVRSWGFRGIDARATGGYAQDVPDVCIFNVNVEACGEIGIALGGSGTIDHCTASECNSSLGGIFATKAVISNSTARRNTGAGIYVSSGSRLIACEASDNTGSGITAFSTTLSGCHATANGTGIFLAFGSAAFDCHAINNNGTGMFVDNQCSAINCTAISNGHNNAFNYVGFALTGNQSHIEGCTAMNNQSGGFSGNNSQTSCFIVRNFASNNGASAAENFENLPAASNQIGPVVSSLGTITSTSPWANFSN